MLEVFDQKTSLISDDGGEREVSAMSRTKEMQSPLSFSPHLYTIIACVIRDGGDLIIPLHLDAGCRADERMKRGESHKRRGKWDKIL